MPGRNIIVDVRKLRASLKMSQSQFSSSFGISIHTLRKWEAGLRHPHGTGRVLLMVISHSPETVKEAVGIAA